jgi:hypothetical protein
MKLQARVAVEALRAGVPNRAAIRLMGTDHNDIETAFDRLLEGAWSDDGGAATGLGVAGGFGSGKSHLLGYLAEVARTQRFVVSRVVISKETPLTLAGVFASAVRSAELPDRNDDAISAALSALRHAPADLAALEERVSTPDSGFAPVFAATLFLLRHAPLPETLRRIERFLAGAPIGATALKRALKDAGAGRMFALTGTDAPTLLEQRVAFLALLFRAAGYAGWCILLDEIELIGRYTPLQRAHAYAWLATWIGLPGARRFAGVPVVYAITDDFATAVVNARQDDEKLPERLRLKGRGQEAQLALAAIRHIEGTIRDRRLPGPSDESLAACQEKLRGLYALAYGVEPGRVPLGERTSSATMRQYTKSWITQWDLLRLAGTRVAVDSAEMASNYEETVDLMAPPPPAEEAE